MDQLSAEPVSSGQNSVLPRSASSQELQSKSAGVDSANAQKTQGQRAASNSPKLAKKGDRFNFKAGFAVSFHPSSNVVKMNAEEEISSSEIETEDTTAQFNGSVDKQQSESADIYDSLSEGMDSVALTNPAKLIKDDGAEILWTSVSASACNIAGESQIRSWFNASKGLYTSDEVLDRARLKAG